MIGPGLALAATIGVALGLTGGSGSVPTVPIVVYVLSTGSRARRCDRGTGSKPSWRRQPWW